WIDPTLLTPPAAPPLARTASLPVRTVNPFVRTLLTESRPVPVLVNGLLPATPPEKTVAPALVMVAVVDAAMVTAPASTRSFDPLTVKLPLAVTALGTALAPTKAVVA